MKKGLTGVVAGWALFYGGLVPPAAVAEPRLFVQVNNLAGFDQASVARAERIVTGIFQDLGVQVVWEDAGVPEGTRAGLGSSPERRILRIRLLAIKPAAMGGHKDLAGMAGLPGNGQPGVLAWVFHPTLEKIIDDVQYRTRQRVRSRLLDVLLGYVIAHEIGHLLTGSAEHSGSGIMTLGWDLRKVEHACRGMLTFTPEQSKKIRAVVQAAGSASYASASLPAR